MIGDVPPELRLGPEDIRALGVDDVGELIEVLAPQIGIPPGEEAIVLLDGRRLAGGLAEVRAYPRESIERLDVLPPEVALSYGYPVGQRVMNLVLVESFTGGAGEVGHAFATAGGRSGYEAKLSLLHVRRENRLSLSVEYRRDSALLESERGLVGSAAGAPFDLLGNVGAVIPGEEIDPALSALAGRSVTFAAVPLSATTGAPAIKDFVAGAGAPNVTDIGDFRTLLPESDRLSINAGFSRPIFGDVAATVSAQFQASDNRSHLGLPSARLLLPAANPFSPFGSDAFLYRYFAAPGPLNGESESRSAALGLTLRGLISGWNWVYIGNFDHRRSSTRTETNIDAAVIQSRIDAGDPLFNPFAPLARDVVSDVLLNSAKVVTTSLRSRMLVNGSLLSLPAGPLSVTLNAGFALRDTSSDTVRAGNRRRRSFSRDQAEGRADINLPIAARGRGFLAPLGDLFLNLNLGVERQTGSDTLLTLGYGIRWTPMPGLRLHGFVTESEQGVSPNQLGGEADQAGDPVVETPNVRVFDFLTGETVEITRIEGGNPELLAPSTRNVSLAASYMLSSQPRLMVDVRYTDSRIRNVVGNFPTATPELEAAFPDRFIRDGEGRLLRIDSRPINFVSADRAQLSWGFNLFMPLGATAPSAMNGGNAAASPGRGRPPGRPRAAAAGGGDVGEAASRPPAGLMGLAPDGEAAGAGRMLLSLRHTIRLRDRILIREGLPELDLLDGTSTSGRGQPRHEATLLASLSRSGWGARLRGIWRSATSIRGGARELFFSDLATINLETSLDLGEQPSLVRRFSWLRGAKVTVAATNLFDARQRVRDADGETPLSYEPALLDPLGRSVTISLRKPF